LGGNYVLANINNEQMTCALKKPSSSCVLSENLSLGALTVALIAFGIFGIAKCIEVMKDPASYTKKTSNFKNQTVQEASEELSPLTRKAVAIWDKALTYSIRSSIATGFCWSISHIISDLVHPDHFYLKCLTHLDPKHTLLDLERCSLPEPFPLSSISTTLGIACIISLGITSLSILGGIGVYFGTRNERLKKLMGI
jgi:hypothetical protein